jgi:thiol-disulfide isomerase/thioredoxin
VQEIDMTWNARKTARRRGLVAVASWLIAMTPFADVAVAGKPTAAPELPVLPAADWLNSKPLTLAQLRGRPVLVEFWTFGCSNCRNTLPWLQAMHERYAARGLTIVSVHTPEFPGERDRDAVAKAVARLGIHYPVMIDNGFRYWKALGNRYWPAFYLIDPQGRIVETRIGELHAGRAGADSLERAIAGMMAAAVKP